MSCTTATFWIDFRLLVSRHYRLNHLLPFGIDNLPNNLTPARRTDIALAMAVLMLAA
jgi:hypothetical protein